MLGKDIFNIVYIKYQELYIGKPQCPHLLGSRIQHILLCLDADEIHLRMPQCQLADKITLAGAQFHIKAARPAKDLLPAALLLLACRPVLREYKIIKIVNSFVYPGFSS